MSSFSAKMTLKLLFFFFMKEGKMKTGNVSAYITEGRNGNE